MNIRLIVALFGFCLMIMSCGLLDFATQGQINSPLASEFQCESASGSCLCQGPHCDCGDDTCTCDIDRFPGGCFPFMSADIDEGAVFVTCDGPGCSCDGSTLDRPCRCEVDTVDCIESITLRGDDDDEPINCEAVGAHCSCSDNNRDDGCTCDLSTEVVSDFNQGFCKVSIGFEQNTFCTGPGCECRLFAELDNDLGCHCPLGNVDDCTCIGPRCVDPP